MRAVVDERTRFQSRLLVLAAYGPTAHALAAPGHHQTSEITGGIMSERKFVYKDRMVIEYFDLKERVQKLTAMLDRWSRGMLEFTPKSSPDLINAQLDVMRAYARILGERATVEGVKLTYEDLQRAKELERNEDES
jgi:hypothetical protein